MSITTSSKTKISVGTQAVATDLTTFQADTYTVIGEVESFGAFGDEAEEIKFTSLGDGRVQKIAGVRDAGSVDLLMGFDAADAGQTALIAAFNTGGLPFNFKIELNDALTSGAGPHHGTQFFFKGVVLGTQYDAGTSKDVIKLKVKISLTSGTTEGAAA